MTQEINRRLHEALGKCWHERITDRLRCNCNLEYNEPHKLYIHLKNHPMPDYCADPRLVIEAMRERKDWPEFSSTIGNYGSSASDWSGFYVKLDLIMDKTGKLAVLALEWLGQQEGGERLNEKR